jgi:hypothetical protein
MSIPAEGHPLYVSDGTEWFLIGDESSTLNGSGAPSGDTGTTGDYYVDTTGGVMYGPKQGTSWPITLQPVLVLGPATPVPTGTPAGTVIVRTTT